MNKRGSTREEGRGKVNRETEGVQEKWRMGNGRGKEVMGGGVEEKGDR